MQVTLKDIKPMNTNVIGAISTAQINMDGFAFQALSGKNLYKNMIRAIVREISCNALDAHVMAGTQDRPFDVHIPTALEPYFSVRDYGIGLDDDGVRNVYLTYFGSTKRDDNTQIGAWGLGSKSPLGYTDNFTVTAVKDGIERIYSVFKNENGIPSISIICENPTDKHNGLEVQMAVVDDADIKEFKFEALCVFQYFAIKPNFNVEMNFAEDNFIIKGLGGNINVCGGNSSVVVHGNIAYTLDGSMLKLGWDSYERKLINYGIELHMPHGTVEYAMSREELSYTPDTIANIVSAITSAMKDLPAKLAETVKGLEPFAAYINVESYKHKSFISPETLSVLKKSGVSPFHELPIEHFNVERDSRLLGVKFMKRNHGRRGSKKFQHEAMEWLYPTNVVEWRFIVNEEKNESAFEKKLKHNIDSMNAKLMVIPAGQVEAYSKLVFDKIGYEVKTVSSTEFAAPPKKVTSKSGATTRKDVVYRSLGKVDVNRRAWGSPSYVYRFDKVGTIHEPVRDVKYYVPLKGMECPTIEAYYVWHLCNDLNVDTYNVFGVSEANIKKLSNDWVDLLSVLKDNVKPLVAQYENYGIRYSVCSKIMTHIDTIGQFDDVTILRKAESDKAMNGCEVATLRQAIRKLGVNPEILTSIEQFENDVCTAMNAINTKYPLLDASRDNGDCKFYGHMVEYIKMVNQL